MSLRLGFAAVVIVLLLGSILFVDADVVYENCVEYNNNYFFWTIKDSKIYGRAVFTDAANGWAGIGFRSGYEYLDPVPVDGGVDNSKMLNSLIYVGYRDVYYNHYFHEYIAGSDAIPDKLVPQLKGAGYSRTTNTSSNINIVFERPLVMSGTGYEKYYNFKQGDKSSILFAKTNFKSPRPAGLDDMCRHNDAKIMKVDFFAPSSCSKTVEMIGKIPDYITPLPSNYYDYMDRKESESSSTFSLVMIIYITVGFVMSLLLIR
ncbi:predicted protein [Naegleria gruberi]|uniref:Predicted protein n=1 Tax=Naegleria gruberi TaxID=5762 RepID=D2V5E0_NAEGR|nr:uncharacterized protein NAEGRDRAFT_63788 [Naegleria gruberi]EFC48095.1 predicted protein [Naegleria gruberi]|eukprot:XP_002680839.1 predicted protein [Naegleria gruberi strain NEG-M]